MREALAAGDARTAIALCARQYGASIGRLCMGWLGSQAEAEEAVQETLLAAFDGAAHYRGEGSVPAWLYGIARRVCARRAEVRGRRERQRRLVGSARSTPMGPTSSSPRDAAASGCASPSSSSSPPSATPWCCASKGGCRFERSGRAAASTRPPRESG